MLFSALRFFCTSLPREERLLFACSSCVYEIELSAAPLICSQHNGYPPSIDTHLATMSYTTDAATTFHNFPCLPTELQTQTWRSATLNAINLANASYSTGPMLETRVTTRPAPRRRRRGRRNLPRTYTDANGNEVVRVWALFIAGTDTRYRIVAPWRDLLLVSQDAQGAVLEGLELVFGRRFPRVLWVRVDCNACEHVIERFAPVLLCEVVDPDADAEEDE
jgi:hypothetical protein